MMCFFSVSRLLLPIFILLFIISCCHSQSNSSLFCPPSSCGNIKNISYPFRLRGDPINCGNKGYELHCQNNQTVVTLSFFNGFSEFFVQSINYNNLTIRLVDPGLINTTTNCSLPVHSYAYTRLFDFPNQYTDSYYYPTVFGYYYYNLPIVFISCVDPISYSSSSPYIDISFCGNTSWLTWNPSRTYGYVGVVNLHTQISELPETCGVEGVALASVNGPLAEKNSYLVDIYQGLAYGFELSWYRVFCTDCDTSRIAYCNFEGNSAVVTCKYFSCPGYQSLINVNILHGQIRYASFSIRTSSFYSEISSPKDPRRFLCYFLFWFRSLVEAVCIPIGGLLLLRFLTGYVCLMVLVVHKWRRRHLSADESIEDFLQVQTNLLPIKYGYSDIKKMTNKFKHKLGQGGYGIVYRGKLRSGPLVAVKMMNKSISSEQEFSNEVGTIGRIHHVNVVQLIGFCTEGSKHALVYEYMPNGSLDKYISPTAGQVALTYKNMYDISLGVARGIDYLHKGCDMQILHFDIKPHNILLDEDFKPKVSDFGLAKLYPTNVNTVTLPTTITRGTTGYMAPELFYKNTGGVSYKADVYSFGMLLMELASREENINPFTEDVGQIYFPSWVFDQLNAGKEIDMGNVSDEERMMVKKMIKVALWCIQMKPGNRPSMNKVVEMLEGDVVHMPPRPFIAPHAMENEISAQTSKT